MLLRTGASRHGETHKRDFIIGSCVDGHHAWPSLSCEMITDLTTFVPRQDDFANVILETTGPFMLTRCFIATNPPA